MKMSDKQKQTEKFVGCILSVKTKPGRFGDVQHIIGTVREIDVDSTEQAIVLDQAMSNGAMLPDGYVLLSSQIADLQVMGKANEIQANLKSAYSHSEAIKSHDTSGIDDEDNTVAKGPARKTMSQPAVLANNLNSSFSNGGESQRTVNGGHLHNAGSQPNFNNCSTVLMNSLASAMADLAVRNNLTESDIESINHHTIAKPKPRKPGDKGSSAFSTQENNTNQGTREVANSGVRQVANNNINSSGSINKPSTNVGLSSNPTSGSDILLRTFGNLSTNSGGSLNGQALFNAVANPSKSLVPATNLKQNNASSPSKLSPQKPMLYDHKKLGVLSQFVGAEESQPEHRTPSGRNNTPNDTNTKTFRNHGKAAHGIQRHGETFEAMSKDEMTEDFDFEGSNAQFAKLPVSSSKPVKGTKNPQFCPTDTTYLSDRTVESVMVGETITSVKQFVTDTGVIIPSIDLPTRSKILNLAHEAGLTHSRVVEVMGRAVAQAVLPLLGDSYRLSPERVEDRPWILICAGPHWQGAIGIAAGRILASLGVHTCVHAPKEELQLCRREEKLYSLSGEIFTRQIGDLKGIRFDLVIMAADDHLSRTLTVAPYARWLKHTAVVFVDPPLISSYRQQVDVACGVSQKGRRIVIVSPVLPIAYPTDPTVKIFLVNIGIPQDIFEQNDVVYKSPFGDKLVIQIFGSGSK